MKPQPDYIRKFFFLRSIMALWANRARVQLVLAGWLVPDWLNRGFARIRNEWRFRRAIATAALTLAMVIPSVLYYVERSQRMRWHGLYRHLSTSSASEIGTLRNSMGLLMNEQSQLRALLMDAGYQVVSDHEVSIEVLATGYSSSIMETDDTPYITAWNTPTRLGIVAMSRDLLRRFTPDATFSFGDTVHITGLGEFVVEDAMHPRWRRRVDIWFPSRRSAKDFGVRTLVIRKALKEGLIDDQTAAVLGFNTGAATDPGQGVSLGR